MVGTKGEMGLSQNLSLKRVPLHYSAVFLEGQMHHLLCLRSTADLFWETSV